MACVRVVCMLCVPYSTEMLKVNSGSKLCVLHMS